jgi:hypothetical protein
VEIILWSAGGKKNCENIADDCGIKDIVSLYLTKPAIVVDDLNFEAPWALALKPDTDFSDLI